MPDEMCSLFESLARTAAVLIQAMKDGELTPDETYGAWMNERRRLGVEGVAEPGLRKFDPPLNAEPNAIVVGENRVRCNTSPGRNGCQAVDFHVEIGDSEASGWRPCGLPVFATVYAGQYDEEAQEDVQPVLCWRHLRALGDTGDLIVRPK